MTAVAPTEAFTSSGGAHSDVGVLVLHGITGSPASMRPWADRLAEAGYRVSLPLLPGHGTVWPDLNKVGFDDWLACATAELDKLRTDCRAVVVAGLSMGGTLTLRLGELYPDRIAGLMLVNPSVMSRRLDAKFAPLLNKIKPVVRRLLPSLPAIVDDVAKPGVQEGGYQRLPTLAALSLATAWPKVRADLPLISSPILVMYSTVDHVVEPENAAIVLAEVSSSSRREVLLRKSYHVATLDYDAEEIFAESLTFLAEVTA